VTEDDTDITAAVNRYDRDHPEPPPAPPLIEGILRIGGMTGTLSGSKCKKSRALLHLLLSIASGKRWLGHACRKGRVLLVDLETQRGDWSARLDRVAAAMGGADVPGTGAAGSGGVRRRP
jgi:RecA-family ATPase